MQRSARGIAGVIGASTVSCATKRPGARSASRPNILFAIADDWSWPYASIYGARGVHTPAFDRVAREGCLFSNAIAAAPQCSPNRAAILTGRNIWQLEEAGTHASIFPTTHASFVDLLEAEGYFVGFTGKGWGPGDWARGGWKRNPAGPEFTARKLATVPADGISDKDYAGNFEDFLTQRPADSPFCFWYGAHEPHLRYEEGSGARAGKRAVDVDVPPFLPDVPTVRNDFLDHFLEVEWFDTHLGRMMAMLESRGELDNTLIVVTGDNGVSVPRAKANVYEYGIHLPLAVRWPGGATGGTNISSLVSCIDFAPTFLDAAGVPVPPSMTGISMLPLLRSGDAAPTRDFVLTGRERHTHARFDNLGYPSRAIRTRKYLYIRNMKADRWPAGDPDNFYDVDASPTKSLMLEHRDELSKYFDMAFSKRPEVEFFDIQWDPGCMNDLANSPSHAAARIQLDERLMQLLEDEGDPRASGSDVFDSYPRISEMRPELGGFAERGQYNPKYQQ